MKATAPTHKPHMSLFFKNVIPGDPRVGVLRLAIAAVAMGMFTASATIVPYSWQRFDVYKQHHLDSTGLGHTFGGFDGNGEVPRNTQQQFNNIAVGGPLGPDGLFSSYSVRTRANGNNQGCYFAEPVPLTTNPQVSSGAWGNLFQSNGNWVVEAWYLPARNGAGGVASPIFATGLNRNNRSPGRQSGVAMVAINGTSAQNPAQNDGHVWLRCQANCPANVTNANGPMDFYIGPPVLIKTPTNAAWVHVAVVRDEVAGTVAWYTNGAMVAFTGITNVYTTNYFSSPGFAGIQDSGLTHTNGGIGLGGGAQPLVGYMAELRWSYFLPGEFSVTNLLTRRSSPGSPTVWLGPSIVRDPQNATVWEGRAGAVNVTAATDTSITYQWQRNAINISGATNRIYVKEATTVAGDSGAQFRCILTKSSLSVTSAVATLTVLANDPNIVTGYSNAVMAEASLKAYFPVDGSSSTVLNNVKDPTHHGAILNSPFAFLNGNTNLVHGRQTLSLNTPNLEYAGHYGLGTNQHGYVEIAGDNPDYTFTSGNGTIEAVLYMEPSAKHVLSTEQLCWLSSATVANTFDYYNFSADVFGNLYYQNGQSGGVKIWTVPGGLVGKRTHVAFVFSNKTNVTCYVNGVNLGTKTQADFGNTPPDAFQPLTIGKRGGDVADEIGYFRNAWRGSVDDLAIYGSALSAGTISSHYYALVKGTAPAPASIAKISPSKNLYLGYPVQVLSVTAGGTPPYTYQWRSNNVALAGAVNPTLTVPSLPLGVYNYSVVVQGSVGSAITSAPVVLTVVAPSGYSAKVFASSGGAPKAYYPLNESSGTTVFDWAGTHDGVLSGVYSLANTGPVVGESSIRMFGTNLLNPVTQVETPSQAEVPYYPELNPENGGNFTHEFWYRPDNINRTICALSSQFNVGANKAGLATMMGPGNTQINQTVVLYWAMIYGKYNNVNQGVAQNFGQQSVTPPVNGQWQHIASVADGNNSTVTLYVNGVPEFTQNVGYSQHPGDGSVTGGVNQNYFAPLILGNRNLGAFPMEGSLSQVAVYDYALNFNDITNHTSQVWTQAFATLQPVGKTNVESLTATITLTANALGAPNSYQWQKDGVDLVQTYNLDGTEHYPRIFNAAGASQGVDSKTLVISQTKTNDSGQYRLKIINPLNAGGFTNTVSVSVLITNDTTLPTVTRALARGTMVSGPVIDEVTGTGGNPTPAPLFLVEVRYSKRMDPTTATNPANYFISGGVTVTNVVLATSAADTKFGGDYKTVGLVTAGLTPGASYTVTVSGVNDQSSFPNPITPATIFFTAPSLRANTAIWDYYYRVSGQFDALASGTNTAFPYVPQVTTALTNFSSDAVAYSRNLGNNPAFTGQSDTYASTISALATPTNTGYYEFFINADDKARLYLNPSGANPAGAGYIGESFSGGTAFNDLYAIPTHYLLTSGQSYFLQAVHTENTGNDDVRVGWRYLGTVDQPYDGSGANGAWIVEAANLPPIEGKFLSAYTVAQPVISVQPINIVAPVGTTTNLFVTVASTGTGTTNYQWQRSIAGANSFADVAGKTARTNSFAPLANGDYGDWRVKVDDGSIVTPTFSSTVTVRPPGFTITTPPASKAVPVGVLTTNTVAATTFSGAINYQWRFFGSNLTTSANISGVTAQTMTINSMRSVNAGPYTVVVNDGYNFVTSTPAANLTIATNPVLQQLLSGSTLNLTFPTEVGPLYVVEFKNALTNGAWNTLSNVAGNGTLKTVPVGTTTSERYFRIRMQ